MAKKQMVVMGEEVYVHSGGDIYAGNDFEFIAHGEQFPHVNRLLTEGWRVVSVTPSRHGNHSKGKFLFVLEKG